MVLADSAEAHFVKDPKKAYYHALGAKRFFKNHPRITATPAGRVARRNHRWLLHYAKMELLRLASPQFAICSVFGEHCSAALRVSYCETGGTYSIYAENGQYLGLFQMGSWEREKYGHGWNAWSQARAAYRYFRASGSDWSPWECKP